MPKAYVSVHEMLPVREERVLRKVKSYNIPVVARTQFTEPLQWPLMPCAPRVYKVGRQAPIVGLDGSSFERWNASQQRAYMHWRDRRRMGELLEAPPGYAALWARDVAAGWETNKVEQAEKMLRAIPIDIWPAARRIGGRYLPDLAYLRAYQENDGKKEKAFEAWREVALEEVQMGSALGSNEKSYLLEYARQEDQELAAKVLLGMFRIRARGPKDSDKDEMEAKLIELVGFCLGEWERWTGQSLYEWVSPGEAKTEYSYGLRGCGPGVFWWALPVAPAYAKAKVLRATIKAIADHLNNVSRVQAEEEIRPRQVPWLPGNAIDDLTEQLGGWGEGKENPYHRVDFMLGRTGFAAPIIRRHNRQIQLDLVMLVQAAQDAGDAARMLTVEDEEDKDEKMLAELEEELEATPTKRTVLLPMPLKRKRGRPSKADALAWTQSTAAMQEKTIWREAMAAMGDPAAPTVEEASAQLPFKRKRGRPSKADAQAWSESLAGRKTLPPTTASVKPAAIADRLVLRERAVVAAEKGFSPTHQKFLAHLQESTLTKAQARLLLPGIMIDGMIERLNEEARKRYNDDAVIEDDGMYTLNPYVTLEI